jgi:sialate O-acetylesterase
MKKNLLSLLIICGTLLPFPLHAQVKLSPLFTSNMVLQQQTQAPVWGTDKPNKKITLTTSWDKKTYTTTTSADGSWQIKIATPKAGGPYIMTISDGKPVVISNVLIGEVWVCSGQSNMEMPVEGWGKVNNYKEEEANANYPNIRLLQVHKNTSTVPLKDFTANGETGGWQVCSGKAIAEFSACGYFFGRNLNKSLNVPIGLIDTSWGGTFIEAWTSADALSTHPDMVGQVDKIKQMPATVEGRNAEYNKSMQQWKTSDMAKDSGFNNGKATWASQTLSEDDWKHMTLPAIWEQHGLDGVDGSVWFRTTVDIPTSWKGKELTLHLGTQVDDIDYTFFNGEPIGETFQIGINRAYKVPAKLVKAGKALVTVRVIDTGGLGGLYSEAKEMYIEGPGKQQISLAKDWAYKPSLALNEIPTIPTNSATTPNKPTFLYNAMISPLLPFAIKGAIWYQGENNERTGYLYRDLLPLMIRDWRTSWGYNFPFYIVQLANYKASQPYKEGSQWAEIREAQMMAAQHVEKSGMACIIDIGNPNDIHPKDKQEVGRRLSLVARAKTYGEDIPYSGPVYKNYRIEGKQIRILFDHVDGGLKTSDEALVKSFSIAGADKKFHPATATIEGNDIVVTSPDVPFPEAVRYAWDQCPECNLYNGIGLPAVPFRTDDWAGVSYGVKYEL